MWISILVNPSGYILGAALLHLGLGCGEAALAVLCGSCLLVVALVMNAYAGAKYGIPFPVLARSAFGFEGAKVVAVLRGVIAIYYISINMWIGAEALVKGYDAVISHRNGGDDTAFGSSSSGSSVHGSDSGAGVSTGRLLCFAGFAIVHLLIFSGDGIRVMRLLVRCRAKSKYYNAS